MVAERGGRGIAGNVMMKGGRALPYAAYHTWLPVVIMVYRREEEQLLYTADPSGVLPQTDS
jgi:hypothetical protein